MADSIPTWQDNSRGMKGEVIVRIVGDDGRELVAATAPMPVKAARTYAMRWTARTSGFSCRAFFSEVAR